MLALIQYQSTPQSSLFTLWIISSRIKITQGFFPFFPSPSFFFPQALALPRTLLPATLSP